VKALSWKSRPVLLVNFDNGQILERSEAAGLVVSQVELVEKKSMYFFAWQGGRRRHGEPCNDEQHRQAKKDAIYSRRFSLTDY
jgi:trehalose-6-phosphate synthase